MLRELIYYAKKHPIKVFMLVIMPLLTGGGLLTLLKRFGIPLPPEIGRLVGGLAKSGGEGGGIAGYAAKAATLGTGLGSAATIIKAVQAFM